MRLPGGAEARESRERGAGPEHGASQPAHPAPARLPAHGGRGGGGRPQVRGRRLAASNNTSTLTYSSLTTTTPSFIVRVLDIYTPTTSSHNNHNYCFTFICRQQIFKTFIRIVLDNTFSGCDREIEHF